MFYQLLILAVVLGLIAFYAFEGLFNALVAAVCAIGAAVVAFNFFEPLARAMGDSSAALRMGPAIALVVLFVAVMEALRFGATKLLPGMVHVPLLADRIGGAVLGAVPALLIGGVMAISLRLLPFGPSLMGYKPLAGPPTGQGQLVVEPLWLRPDGFTVDLVDKLSAGSLSPLSGGQRFDQVHPEYLAELAGFNDFASTTKEPFSANALEDLRLFKPGDKTPIRDNVQVRGEFRDPAHEVVPPGLAKGADVRALALTVHVRLTPEEPAPMLAGPQAQLTCRAADGSVRMIVPQWIAENPKNPSDVVPLPIDKAWIGGTGPQNITLFYAVPKEWTPKYLTVKRDTRVEPEMRGEKDKWSVQPAVTSGDAAAAGIATTWLTSAGWTKAVSYDLPSGVVLVARQASATSPDTDVNPKLVGARVTLALDKSLATARVAGPDALLRDLPGGAKVNKLFVPPGRKVVQLKCSPTEKIPLEDWTALLTAATVTVDDKPVGSVAGLAVIYTTNKDVRFCYDPAPGVRFAEFIPDPKDALRADFDQFVVLIVIPIDAHSFTLDISRDLGLQMRVELGKQ